MTQPKWATQGKMGRVYRFPDDSTDYPSVTTLIKMLDKWESLKWWATRNVAEAAVADLDKWSQMSDREAIDYLRMKPFNYTGEKADYGSLIHELIETGVDSNLPRIGVAAVAIGDLFGEHYGSELTLVNTEIQYAGTADVLTYLVDSYPENRTEGGAFCVADWKTGKVGYLEQAAQLAMLALCTHIVSEDGDWVPLPEQPTVGLAVSLQDDGYRAVELDLSEFAMRRWKPFVGALKAIYEVKKWWGKDGQWSDEYNRRVR